MQVGLLRRFLGAGLILADDGQARWEVEKMLYMV